MFPRFVFEIGNIQAGLHIIIALRAVSGLMSLFLLRTRFHKCITTQDTASSADSLCIYYLIQFYECRVTRIYYVSFNVVHYNTLRGM